MELLTHFNLYTYTFSSSQPVLSTMVQQYYPRLGFQYPFFLRACLAFTALHLGYLYPAKRKYYTSYAAKLHKLAVIEADALKPNSDSTPDDYTVVVLFEAMNSHYRMSPLQKDDDPEFLAKSRQFMVIHRITAAMNVTPEAVYSPQMYPILAHGGRRMDMLIAAIQERAQCKDFDDLLRRIVQLEENSLRRRTYEDTIGIFQAIWVVVNETPFDELETSDLIIGLYNVPMEYIKMLQEHDQVALVIFAYAGVALQRVEAFWWLEGRSIYMISEVWKLLDEEHREWMTGPCEKTGWVPPNVSSSIGLRSSVGSSSTRFLPVLDSVAPARGAENYYHSN